jgi:hypothetical protein
VEPASPVHWCAPWGEAPQALRGEFIHIHGSEYVLMFVKLLIASCTPSL